MKHLLTPLFASFLTLLFLVACEDTQQIHRLENDTIRSAQQEAHYINFEGRMISLDAEDIISITNNTETSESDAQIVMNLNNAFLGAEKQAQSLAVNFHASDEPVKDGLYIFNIESDKSDVLELDVFDEEGFAMVANNEFVIDQGNNYKAVNVTTLESGAYQFRLKDKSGKELNRRMIIE